MFEGLSETIDKQRPEEHLLVVSAKQADSDNNRTVEKKVWWETIRENSSHKLNELDSVRKMIWQAVSGKHFLQIILHSHATCLHQADL